MSYQIEKDVAYIKGSTNPRQKLDIYRPENASGEKLPAIMYLHGGGWEYGVKDKAITRLEHYFDTGYILIAIGYRLSDEAIWPAPMDDAVAALKYIQTEIPDVDPDRIGLWGSSAGGHLACLAAGGCRSEAMPDLKCVINYCAPATINEFVKHLTGAERKESSVMKLLGGDHEKTENFAEEATVTNWIKPGYPPTLSIHGDEDTIVPIAQSERVTEAVEAVGSEAKFHIVEGSQHRINEEKVREVVKAFLSKYFC